MTIKFDETAYYKAIIPYGKQVDPGWVKNNQKFSYGNPEDEKYSKSYNDSGWIGRKIIALPAAAWSGIAKVIYHLAKAAICWVPGIAEKPGTYFKVQIYSAVRDLQESFGRILTIFSDKKGLYHIQQASFHKSCYECFLSGPDTCHPDNEHFSESSDEIPQKSDLARELRKIQEDMHTNLQRQQSKMNTEALNKFDRSVEDQLIKIEDIIKTGDPDTKQMFINSCVNSIEQYIKLNLALNSLTKEQINTTLDSFITSWTDAEYSFLSGLKV